MLTPRRGPPVCDICSTRRRQIRQPKQPTCGSLFQHMKIKAKYLLDYRSVGLKTARVGRVLPRRSRSKPGLHRINRHEFCAHSAYSEKRNFTEFLHRPHRPIHANSPCNNGLISFSPRAKKSTNRRTRVVRRRSECSSSQSERSNATCAPGTRTSSG